MMLIKLSAENWENYYENNWCIKFIIYSIKNLNSITLQVKQKFDSKLKLAINESIKLEYNEPNYYPKIITIRITSYNVCYTKLLRI